MQRNVVVLAALVALVVVAATVLAAMGTAVPSWFDKLAVLLAGGAAGVAVPPRTDPPPGS